ncbi:M23 family metallopeptidase [Myroides marinus]|jgi:murein DD-endopeptidase MepM/ murein hydrolase activator NlpD|uniref:Peptidase n=1 Tax=Myroides marinus TaxID=703342 RepID=A0A163ZAE1_9FLAO|nr:M23 family metallopeptidase [Myroides marinus]MDR0194273.1 M23 family metallopeptidase [Myroides sp.]KUF44731.1 peptidase [Myroides marinus]KZE81373.1 peptidase [Myroides marinus]MDM1348021.1 M23 family metallopeptidase [Myroides marinus]MDM1350730.1 M23 family metallopeptidase [Myroides marinus]
MLGKGHKRKKWKSTLLSKYRIVIVNDKTFEDVKSFKLNLLNVFGASTTLVFLFILSTVLLLVLTPLKEYIPGYSSAELKQRAVELALKVDSLENESRMNQQYLSAIKSALLGEIQVTKASVDSLALTQKPLNQIEHKDPSETDLKLREMVRLEDKYNIFEESKPKVSQVLFSPINAEIVKKYDSRSMHFGIDFRAPANTPVKAIGRGTVLFVDWTIKDGYTIILLHDEGLISVYKHLTSLTKGEYESVRSGEVIGLFDGSSEASALNASTKYFHFELWKDSYPLDSSLFIDLE